MFLPSPFTYPHGSILIVTIWRLDQSSILSAKTGGKIGGSPRSDHGSPRSDRSSPSTMLKSGTALIAGAIAEEEEEEQAENEENVVENEAST